MSGACFLSLSLLLLSWCSVAVGQLTAATETVDGKCFKLLDRRTNAINATLVDPGILYYQLNTSEDKAANLRYVWSTVGTPTLFFSVTPDSDNMDCNESVSNSFPDWDAFNKNQSEDSAQIPGYNGSFSFAIVFESLIEYRDENAKGNLGFNVSHLSNASMFREYPLKDLEWEFDEKKQNLTGVSLDGGFSWQIQINVPVKNGRLDYFPKSLFTNTSTTFDFVFYNFTYSSISMCQNMSVQCGRLVLKLRIVHGPNTKNGTLNSNFSLDDEYTPSVFLTKTYLFGSQPKLSPGYLQWKPISYLSASRQSTSSQQANIISSTEESPLPPSLASALFGEEPDEDINVTTIYVVFGTEGDDNNMNPEYVTWTAVLGYGTPEYDVISIVVIITIIIGLGLPVVFIFIAAGFVVFKKKPWQNIAKFVKKITSTTAGYEIVRNGQQ